MAQEPNTLALPNTRLIRNIPYALNGHKLRFSDLSVTQNATKPMTLPLWIHGGDRQVLK
ncbi:MAG: hypothetical protein WKF66_15590 [Pedobacter sp.]